jgi:Ca2+-binding EF-hand superfamily protein
VVSYLSVYYSEYLNKDEFELLLMALNHHLTAQELDACFVDMGIDPNGGSVNFDLFFEWWTDSMGVEAIRKKQSGLNKSQRK